MDSTPASTAGPGSPPWASDPATAPADWVRFPPDAVETSLWSRFVAVASTHGERPALVEGDDVRTYAQVRDQVAAAGAAMADRAEVAGRPVALLMTHGSDLVVALLAAMAARASVVVLDPVAPPEVTRTVVAAAAPALVVHDAAQADAAAALGGGGTVVAFAELASASAPPLTVEPGPDDIAMLAYTSGTTGTPKAAELSHRALLHLMRGAADSLAISPSDRLPMLFPLSLAVAAYPALLPLMAGAALCPFDMRSLGLAPFPEFLAEARVSVIYFSPTVARFLEGTPSPPLPELRLVVLGGERVDQDAVDVVRRVFGDHVRLANGYGTTETGVLTFFFLDPSVDHRPDAVPVGQPIVGMDLRLVDEVGRLVAAGEIGELEVASRYLFSGYRDDPEATARVLRPAEEAGEAVYRTGDVGRIDDHGCLHLVGRADTEVKVRGHRVVPGEVEQALLALPEVRDAVVEGRTGPDGVGGLVAWVVPDPERPELDAPAIRRALEPTVKAHLVPGEICLLDELPQLPNGKLDRQALPAPGSVRPLGWDAMVVPRDDLERDLAAIWSDVLGVAPVGVRDAFVDLGGHSLDLARVVVRIEEDLGVRLLMSDLIDVRTVEDMARVVARRREATGRQSTVVVVQEGDPSRRPPLFFVHDLYGSAYVLRFLAPLLGPDQPLMGFESPLLKGPPTPFRALETLALRYATDIRLAQPDGPYHLAGYSFGGILAFEIARQMVADGDEVAFLGIIDIGPGYQGINHDRWHAPDRPWFGTPAPAPADWSASDRLAHYRRMARRSPRGAARHLFKRAGLDWWSDPVEWFVDVKRHGEIPAERRMGYAWRKHWELAKAYSWEDRTYPGDLTLFWAEESGSTDGTMGWGPIVTGRLDIRRIAFPHEEALQEDHVALLAEPLRVALEERLGAAEEHRRSQ